MNRDRLKLYAGYVFVGYVGLMCASLAIGPWVTDVTPESEATIECKPIRSEDVFVNKAIISGVGLFGLVTLIRAVMWARRW